MGSPVDLSRQARKDLREIGAFISQNNPTRALTFCQELVHKARALGDHPLIGRVLPGGENETLREIAHGAYRIIYKVTSRPTRIFILRFWHGARGAPQIVED